MPKQPPPSTNSPIVEPGTQPAPADPDDTACRMSKAEGVLVSIDTDAHGVCDFDNLRSNRRRVQQDAIRGRLGNESPDLNRAAQAPGKAGACHLWPAARDPA